MSERTQTPPPIEGLSVLNDLAAGGGVERIVQQQMTSVFAADQPLAVLFGPLGPKSAGLGKAASLGVPVPPYSGLCAEVRAVLSACVKLWLQKKRDRVRVCVSHKEAPNFANVISGISKTIVTVHEAKSRGMKYQGLKRRLTAGVIRLLYNRADKVVAVSQGIAQDLIEHFGIRSSQLRVITNPCDVAAVTAAAATGLLKKRLQRGPPTLMSVGRLETQKGQWHLIRAFARVCAAIPEARLKIAGTGDHREYLESLVRDLGLTGSVEFTGFLSNPHATMAQADVFVLSSLWEGFPLVLAEAMACGVPVVATDCPTGAREILAPGSKTTELSAVEFAPFGVLVPRLDGIYHAPSAPLTGAEAKLADACLTLLRDTGLQEHYRAQGFLRMHAFSMESYAAAWRSLVAEVCAH